LLAVVLFDSALGLNPRLLIRSISNTFFPYLRLVVLFITSIVLLGIVNMQVEDSPLWVFILRSAGIYIAFIAAHILGRFYWRYQKKLNWDLKM
jgi:amino acid transporter